jgi:thioredoxin-related protein
MTFRVATLLLAMLFAAAGDATAGSGNDGLPPGIDWFDGTIDEAFATAKAAEKPVYLYWGAEWCPPCHAIKATVFRSPEFIERSKLFVPVYLDGDYENAQAAGQRFGVLGYPTMIVFDAAGNELTRIPGGIDLEAYAKVLDLTLSRSSSTRALVARALATNAPLEPRDCEQLAYYSWGQDSEMFESLDRADTLRRLWSLCPRNRVRERALLYSGWLEARLAAGGQGGAVSFDEDESGEVIDFLFRLLDDEQLARDNVLLLNASGAELVAAVTAPASEQRARLERGFRATYDRLFADENLYKRERIYTLQGKIAFERIDNSDAPLSEALERELRDATVWADESTPARYERQPVINAMANVLGEAGMHELRRELLLAELEISSQPYYYMRDLADAELALGNGDRALEWLKRGWEESTGTATRFEWGYYYLTGLLDISPGDTDTIRRTTVRMIDELQDGGGFYHRPKIQLQRIEDALIEWSVAQSRPDALRAIHREVAAVCHANAEAESRGLCEEFLETI